MSIATRIRTAAIAIAVAAGGVMGAAVPADAAGGGRSTTTDRNSTCNVEVIGRDAAGRGITAIMRPNAIATGFARVDQFRVQRGCLAKRACWTYYFPAGFEPQKFDSSRNWTACTGTQRMVLITWRP